MSERPDPRTRRWVAERAGFRCEYCLTPSGLAPSPFAAEHIVPRSKGGGNSAANLAFACQGCNGHKSARTTALDPVTLQTVALFHPRRQGWKAHFQWVDGGMRIEGVSPIGRATVTSLQLNRAGLVNLRRLLIVAKIHPLS